MIANLPSLTQAGVAAGSITAIVLCGYTLVRLFRSAQAAVKRGISVAVDGSTTGHLVSYHLGPNGSTRPVHERLKRLEEVHSIEPGPGDPVLKDKEVPA